LVCSHGDPMEPDEPKTNGGAQAAGSSAYPGKGLGPRAALILGFSALLVLMVVLAVDSVRALHELETSTTQVRRDYLNRERALREIRGGIYDSGNLLREFADTEQSAETRNAYLAQLDDAKKRSTAAMRDCVRQSPQSLRGPLEKLSSQLDDYWRAADETLNEGAHKNYEARLRQAALTQRAAVLAITSEVSDVNELEFRQAEVDVSKVFAGSRQRLQGFAVLTVGVGFLLAISSILYILHLEKHAQERYHESERYRRELKALSKRLVEAQENERRAISRDLHDQIAQTLAALLMNIQSMTESRTNPDSLKRALQKIRLQAEECVQNVRNMALLLRPSMLDDLGLVAALEWQGREVSKRSGLVVDVIDNHFVDDLPDTYKTCIYRVVQEALHNCTAHARARHARVSLEEDSQHCILSITDDGVGFDPTRQRGMGLLGMQERVTQLGGTFAVESAPGKGTSIRVELPLAATTRSESYVS